MNTSKNNRLIAPIQEFIKTESFSGILLLISAVLALIVANSPLADWYTQLFQAKLTIGFEGGNISKPLILWINDGLMAIFFLLIGLEIKREIK